MTINAAHLTSIMEWMSAQSVKELDLTENGVRIQCVRHLNAPSGTGALPAPALSPALAAPEAGRDALTITADMSGLCHLTPDPSSPPFVQVGDRVSPGQTLYVIEAMKVMTSVSAAVGGTVEEILIGNGDQVQPGTPLFRISA